ncbi:MFS general substrate transporter [Exidia glandulosa HHB12029]|uniref:MFS general substrate transporter n=1 Tax=Exidia glandulosa HHB12029 TaxID=1314781 RepID=A0A165LNM1_EXIGL|nr:MFS general substrate transporter [Exidia glandulosa HHB12029]
MASTASVDIELQATHLPPADGSYPAQEASTSKKQKAEDAPAYLDSLTVNVVETRTALSISSARRSSAVEWFQFSTLCLCLFLAGWNDASLGPLLSTIQNYYGIGYTEVSTIFLSKCGGFIIGSFSSLWLTDKIGFGKCLVLGAVVQALAYAGQVPAPHFAVLDVMNVFVGMGIAIQHAQCNGFVASAKDGGHSKMSWLHACYGLGAVVSPFAATPFAKAQGRRWAYINIISCALSAAVAFELAAVFKGKRQEELMQEQDEETTMLQHEPNSNKYKQVFSLRVVHYLAFFIVLYTGLEITVGGWIVTFIVQERGGGASSGYIAAAFYGGLMLGRLFLLPFSKKIGHRRVIHIYCALAAAMDIVVWQVRSTIGDAVAVSLMGMFLGPLYPLIMSESGLMLPRHLLTGSIGWISGFGQVGSATFPFVTGALASKWGVQVLPPLALVLVLGMPILFVLAITDGMSQRRKKMP